MAEPTDDPGGGLERRQLLAIGCGLLSIVFAVLAGASLSYVRSEPTELLLVPAAFAAASVACIYLKRRFQSPSNGTGEADS